MRVLVCVKRVPAPGAKINITDDGQAVDATNLGHTMSPHEECALELAVQLVEVHGGESHVLTLGTAEAEEQCRWAASIGTTKATLVDAGSMDWDPQRTARALTESIRSIEEADGTFDVMIFGNESADTGGFQVGMRVSRALGRPMVNAIKGVEVADDVLEARRETDDGFEVYKLPMPCAIGVKEGITWPRYPTMRGRLASKKLAVDVASSDAAPGGQTKVRLNRPEEKVSETIILGEGPEAAVRAVELLKELGLWSEGVAS
ncbi:MAG: electron transfer flavoprotein beta subunit [Candidatus Aldehydirespiratoraceae bacterium]|jgi:electron transfer flavoprotein beta subunit